MADHGIDEGVFLVLGSRISLDVHHEQPVRQVDLVGRQPDPVVLVHQIEHLPDDLSQLAVNSTEGLRFVPQRGVGVLDDLHRLQLLMPCVDLEL